VRDLSVLRKNGGMMCVEGSRNLQVDRSKALGTGRPLFSTSPIPFSMSTLRNLAQTVFAKYDTGLYHSSVVPISAFKSRSNLP
jgi:hypothetical protein